MRSQHTDIASEASKSPRGDQRSLDSLDRDNKMNRSLTSRHIEFIALGGAIGTGLFLGSGQSIALTGPSILLVYLLVGLVMFVFMRAIGEMLYRDPSRHSFISFINRYLGHGWGVFAGWTYWIVLLLVMLTNLTAVSQYFVTFFSTFGIDLSGWKWLIEICTVGLLLLINLASAKAFGETEFWFSMIKITLIVGMIVTGIVMACLHFRYPATTFNGVRTPAGEASFSNLVSGFSLAPHGWLNFVLSFQMVFFAYETIEMLGFTISETKDPRGVLPKATNQLMVRILVFYVGALAAIMAIVPWQYFRRGKDGSFASPFIMVFRYAGLDWAASLVFFVVLTAAASSMNSLIYSAGRQLYQVALASPSPRLARLRTVSSNHVPATAIIVSALVGLISPLMSLIPGMNGLFVLFSSCSSAVIVFVYVLTVVAHWKYRNSSDFLPDGFLLKGYRFWDSFAIVFFVFIYVTLFLSAPTRLPAILGLVWLVVFGGACFLRERMAGRGPKTGAGPEPRLEKASDRTPPSASEE